VWPFSAKIGSTREALEFVKHLSSKSGLTAEVVAAAVAEELFDRGDELAARDLLMEQSREFAASGDFERVTMIDALTFVLLSDRGRIRDAEEFAASADRLAARTGDIRLQAMLKLVTEVARARATVDSQSIQT
jgi:hypothetical protein